MNEIKFQFDVNGYLAIIPESQKQYFFNPEFCNLRTPKLCKSEPTKIGHNLGNKILIFFFSIFGKYPKLLIYFFP